jgi:hypothetical protein
MRRSGVERLLEAEGRIRVRKDSTRFRVYVIIGGGLMGSAIPTLVPLFGVRRLDAPVFW